MTYGQLLINSKFTKKFHKQAVFSCFFIINPNFFSFKGIEHLFCSHRAMRRDHNTEWNNCRDLANF